MCEAMDVIETAPVADEDVFIGTVGVFAYEARLAEDYSEH
jgi:hypothetical protein